MSAWYAVMTKPRAEPLVAAALKKAGHDILFLHYRKPCTRHDLVGRQRYFRIFSLYQRYLFAAGNAHTIDRTQGAVGVVRAGEQALEIPEPVIAEQRAKGDKRGRVPEPVWQAHERERFVRGQTVRILDGPLIGFLAEVGLDTGREVVIWLDAMGRRLRLPVGPESLAAAGPNRRSIAKARR